MYQDEFLARVSSRHPFAALLDRSSLPSTPTERCDQSSVGLLEMNQPFVLGRLASCGAPSALVMSSAWVQDDDALDLPRFDQPMRLLGLAQGQRFGDLRTEASIMHMLDKEIERPAKQRRVP